MERPTRAEVGRLAALRVMAAKCVGVRRRSEQGETRLDEACVPEGLMGA